MGYPFEKCIVKYDNILSIEELKLIYYELQ